jgi:1-deoxy-D-xylulose-5-phosphate reductoisomerase
MKRVVILGSTGSIGRASLQVIEHLKSDYQVFALAARTNIDLLTKQAKKFRPKTVIAGDSNKLPDLKQRLAATKISVLSGINGMNEAAAHAKADIVIIALSGSEGIYPTIAAIEKRKRIAIATKEILVSFGKIVMEKALNNRTEILPIDSEQVALHQCLEGRKLSEIKRVILTASGGPFLKRKNLKNIKLSDALNHPIWQMGKKITIDSATLMNKGLEVIETIRLWNLSPNQVDVLIHPQSLVHSMVEFIDGSLLAQLAIPDMRLPIQYALTFPSRLPSLLNKFDFFQYRYLQFLKPNFKKFPCLKLSYQAIQSDNGYPCVLNAANEVAVESFLNHIIKFPQIPEIIKKTLKGYKPQQKNQLEDLIAIEKWAKSFAKRLIEKTKERLS